MYRLLPPPQKNSLKINLLTKFLLFMELSLPGKALELPMVSPSPQEYPFPQTPSEEIPRIIKDTPKCLLSIDGGGSRGLIMCLFLDLLTRLTGKAIHELFDHMVGVSTGTIIAAALGTPRACQLDFPNYENLNEGVLKDSEILSILNQSPPPSPYYTPGEIYTFYTKSSSLIFSGNNLFTPYDDENFNTLLQKCFSVSTDPPSPLPCLKTPGEKRWENLKKLFQVEVSSQNDKWQALKEIFQSQEPGQDAPLLNFLKISDLAVDTTFVLYDLQNGKPFLISKPSVLKGKYEDQDLWRIIRAACAAPTFFNPLKVHLKKSPSSSQKPSKEKEVGDAGIVTNNPVCFALPSISKDYNTKPHKWRIVSLGSGRAIEDPQEENKERESLLESTQNNYLEYGRMHNFDTLTKLILTRCFDGYTSHKAMKQFLKAYHGEKLQNHYLRFSPKIPRKYFVTDGKEDSFFEELTRITLRSLNKQLPEIKRFAQILKEK